MNEVAQSILLSATEVVPRAALEATVIEDFSIDRPSISIVHPDIGLISVEVGQDGETQDLIRPRLNDKVERLLAEIPAVPTKKVIRISVLRNSSAEPRYLNDRTVIVGEHQVSQIDWNCGVRRNDLSAHEFELLIRHLSPQIVVTVPRYEGVLDRSMRKRRQMRIALDLEQSKAAQLDVEDILMISGSPGTGKTLVLIARAKWLRSKFPDWKIVMVVYNNLLAKMLRTLPDLDGAIEILTMKQFLEQRGVKSLVLHLSNFDDPEGAAKAAERVLSKISISSEQVNIDALLVDEWQDLRLPYLKYAFSCVRKGGGGIVLAGDDMQAIYTDGYPSAFSGHKVKKLVLKKPYRSTRQILQVAQALDRSYKVSEIDLAPEGEPVTVIFAQHWPQQAAAIATEIADLLERDSRDAGEIAVLCTTKSGANHVASALDEVGIPNVLLTRFWEDPEPAKEAVNIMTIHGGKGFGFNVVFIQGFETLKDRDGTELGEMWRRVGFVGTTRAQDLLFILYGKQTQFVTSVLSLSGQGAVVGRVYPQDYLGRDTEGLS